MLLRPDQRVARVDVPLVEHKFKDVPAGLLSDADLTLLDRLAERNVLTCRPTRAGYELAAQSYVGVITLDRVRLELRPKLPVSGEQLIAWLSYAIGVAPLRPPPRRGWYTADDGLTDLVVAALVDECRELIRHGLRRDYRGEDRVEPVLRGRLDLRAQISRRYGMVDRLQVRTFDRHSDVWENQVCHAALAAGTRLGRNPDVVRAAAEASHAFPPHPGGAYKAVQDLRRARYHRMNAAYRDAHAWADLILGGGGPADLLRPSEALAGSLLIDMDRLWESLVRRLVGDAAAEVGGTVVPLHGENALVVTVDGAYSRTLRPDVLVQYLQPAMVLPVDAKYKHATTQAISSDDLHQLLTYAAAYPMPEPPRAMVVHPTEAGWTRRWVAVAGSRGRLGEILVVGVDIRQHPRDGRDQMRAELDLIRDVVRRP
jgi:5-methylcytosine-specific restriction enzyme subunit McrC